MPPKGKATQSNVQVYVRARPLNAREEADQEKGTLLTLQIVGNGCRMLNPKKDMEVVREEFIFDHCFDSTKPGRSDTQADVYNRLGPQILDNCLTGYNACLFAYGQTGSGKTYTMMGDIDDEMERGVIPRLVNELVDRIEAQKGEKATTTHKLEASYLEIYCERAKDLLVKDSPELQVRSTPERGVFVEGLTTLKVTNAKDVYKLLSQGARNRAVACTNLNAHSSRSHAIFIMNYTETLFASGGGQKVQTRAKTSRVYLVDLAGSERVKLSGVTGANLDEAKKINQSLTTLGRIIDLLAERKPGKQCTLPVRESMLTWLLGDSLGGNSRTIMLAAVSPSAQSYDETLSTLRYAARTKCIINETSINETVDLKLMEELRGQIDDLQIMLKNKSDLENQLQTNEEKMAALQKLLEDERLAKEKSDQEMRERAEEEKKALADKLKLEREQLEQYLGKERQDLQRQLAEAVEKVQKLETCCKGMAREAEHEKRTLTERFETALRDVTNQGSAEQRKLAEKGEQALKRAHDLEAGLQAQAREKAALQMQLDDFQRKVTDMQHEFQLKEQGWKHDRALVQDKAEHHGKRLQEAEAKLHARELEWAKLKEEMSARYEGELAKVQTGSSAKFQEVAQTHQQAMAVLQKQNEERFQRLREELKQQFDADLQRLQQQQEGVAKTARQQFEEERHKLKQQLEACSGELSTVRGTHQRQQAELQWLKQQHGGAQDELKAAKHQYEEQLEQQRGRHAEVLEQAKKQYEEECQRLLHQQGEAVKEAHKKRDGALMEMKRKVGEDMERLKKGHEEKVAKMKAAHDEALQALQGQVDATWERQRQEHGKALASQSAQHAVALEEVERRLADAEARLLTKQQEVESAEHSSAGYVRELQERFQMAERRHKEEVCSLAQKLATLHRILEQELEVSRQMEEQLRTTQRRLEAARVHAAREAQECRLPQELRWALHGLKSPHSAPPPTDCPPESPCSGPRRSGVSPMRMSTPLRESFASPGAPNTRPKELGLCKTPDPRPRTSQKFLSPEMANSPVRHLATPKKGPEEDDDGPLESIGSFNAGDRSCDRHPDHRAQEALALF